ncbi:cytochrome c [Formosimonas limnophila]|uniref:Cytochrome c n=1 Tax=Formosimonas limnophila TaxID=1384487 RepID=A0A8J3FZS2_9BURK|nr:RhuM family protein [Formosimonas limnophila]GHA65383.1 cytochrome c [Formosimonas limnophila]
MNDILIYQTADNTTQVEVQFEGENFWLSQEQIAQLFERDRTVVSKHLRNIFKEGELDEAVVCANFAHTTQHGAIADKTQSKSVKYYNLDAILSVGYRVNSKRGTQFRQWASARLKDYLVQGYAINQKRLDELGQMVRLIEQTAQSDGVAGSEAKGLLDILSHYTKTFVLLNQFDSHNLPNDHLTAHISYEIQYDEAKAAIAELKTQLMAKNEATELFGREKDESFASSLSAVVQSFGGQYLYPSIEEQAAHLLYFVIKNHSFNDGNKRIGAFLFIWFLEKNKHRFKRSGELKINDNALVAIALLVAQSAPNDKDLMIQLIVNLIRDEV